MIVIRPEFYEEFTCLCGACPDTCCRDWDIVADPEAVARYDELPGPLGKEIRRHLIRGWETVFARTEGRCAMLDPDGLCRIQRTLGHDALCRVCRTYPRFVRYFGSRREEGLCLSCPAVLSLALRREEPLQFTQSKTDELPSLNDLDPDRFPALLRLRRLCLSLMQDRRYALTERLWLCLSLADRAQRLLSGRRYHRLDLLIRRFSSPVGRSACLRRFPRRRQGKGPMEDWRRIFLSLEHLTDRWPLLLKSAPACPQALPPVWLEHYALLLGYQFLLDAWEDGDLLTRIKFTAVSVLLAARTVPQGPESLSGRFLAAGQLYAKEICHNEDNLNALYRAIRTRACFSLRAFGKALAELQ